MATIRPARQSDMRAVEHICRMTAGNLARTNDIIGEATAKTYSTYYIRECTDTCFVLADDTDTPVGYILCEPDYKRYRKVFRKKDVPAIYSIYKKDGVSAWFLPVPFSFFGRKYPAHLHIDILPEYQNKGYGRLLVNELLTELHKRQVKGVMLTADAENDGAIRFYKRLGFETVVCSKRINAIIMAKNIFGK